eukprot:scaffold317503_cov35-Tisochrysis_lutea.AAC.2
MDAVRGTCIIIPKHGGQHAWMKEKKGATRETTRMFMYYAMCNSPGHAARACSSGAVGRGRGPMPRLALRVESAAIRRRVGVGSIS